jgi:hypothetical protein
MFNALLPHISTRDAFTSVFVLLIDTSDVNAFVVPVPPHKLLAFDVIEPLMVVGPDILMDAPYKFNDVLPHISTRDAFTSVLVLLIDTSDVNAFVVPVPLHKLLAVDVIEPLMVVGPDILIAAPYMFNALLPHISTRLPLMLSKVELLINVVVLLMLTSAEKVFFPVNKLLYARNEVYGLCVTAFVEGL